MVSFLMHHHIFYLFLLLVINMEAIDTRDFVVIKASILLKQYRRKKCRVLHIIKKVDDGFIGKHVYLHPSNYTTFYFTKDEVEKFATKAEVISYKHKKFNIPTDTKFYKT